MKTRKTNRPKMQKLSDMARKIDQQLMDLLVSELENLRQTASTQAGRIKIA